MGQVPVETLHLWCKRNLLGRVDVLAFQLRYVFLLLLAILSVSKSLVLGNDIRLQKSTSLRSIALRQSPTGFRHAAQECRALASALLGSAPPTIPARS